jgi:uncharacterized protein YjbJ (UPF0337 family)
MHHDKETNGKETFLGKEAWEAKKQKLKEKYPELTDEDLSFEEGKEDGMIEKIQSKIGGAIGKTKEGLHKFIEAL